MRQNLLTVLQYLINIKDGIISASVFNSLFVSSTFIVIFAVFLDPSNETQLIVCLSFTTGKETLFAHYITPWSC